MLKESDIFFGASLLLVIAVIFFVLFWRDPSSDFYMVGIAWFLGLAIGVVVFSPLVVERKDCGR